MTSSITATKGVSSAAIAGPRNRRAWLFGAAAAFLAGLLAAATWTGIGLWNSWRAPDDFARTGLPGTLVIQVDQAGTQYLYAEHPHGTAAPALEQLRIQVSGRDRSVAVDPTRVTMEYDSSTGDVGTLVGTFRASTPGTYTVNATDAPAGTTLAVGDSVAHSFITAMLGSMAVAGLGVVAAIVFVLMALRSPRGRP